VRSDAAVTGRKGQGASRMARWQAALKLYRFGARDACTAILAARTFWFHWVATSYPITLPRHAWVCRLASAVSYITLLPSLLLLVCHSLQLVKMNPNHQDWDTVVIRKKAPSTAALKDEGAVNAARRTGAAVETVKKFTAGSNKVNLGTATTTGKSAVKLEAETEDFKRERLLLAAVKHGHAYRA
jgi:hypothetical protein